MGQTALQKLIDFINEDLEIKGISLVKRAKLEKVKAKALSLLPEEKQGIVDAYDKGISDYCNYDPERHGNEAPSGINYFNQKYSSEQDVKQKQ